MTEALPEQYRGDPGLEADWQYMEDYHVGDLVRSGDVTPEMLRALRLHYGYDEDGIGGAATPVPLSAKYVRQFARLRDEWPYFFVPPKGNAYRSRALSQRKAEELVGQLIEPVPRRKGDFKDKYFDIPIDTTVLARRNRSWSLSEWIGTHWATKSERKPVVVSYRALSTDDFLFHPDHIYELVGGDPARRREQEVVPYRDPQIDRVTLVNWRPVQDSRKLKARLLA